MAEDLGNQEVSLFISWLVVGREQLVAAPSILQGLHVAQKEVLWV